MIERAGRHYLISQLIAGDIEVATPERDRGIDLIAYLDREGDTPGFLACPIQLKANEKARFGVDQKYAHIPNLLMVYVWNVSEPSETAVYALTYKEAVELLSQRGHTDTKSWNELGGYSLSINDTWRGLLAPYRMKPELWKPKMLSVCRKNQFDANN